MAKKAENTNRLINIFFASFFISLVMLWAKKMIRRPHVCGVGVCACGDRLTSITLLTAHLGSVHTLIGKWRYVLVAY